MYVHPSPHKVVIQWVHTYIPLEVHRYFDFILHSVKNILLKYEMAIYTVRKDAMQYMHQNLERLLTANRAGVLNNFVLSTTVFVRYTGRGVGMRPN